MTEWDYLAKKYKIEGARARFEEICTSLLRKKFIGYHVKSPRVSAGDGGIDVFVGELGISPVRVYQCKFFLDGIAASQKQQIKASFQRVITAEDYKAFNWTLCLPIRLSKEEHLWWFKWKTEQEEQYHLDKDFIQLQDGLDLIEDLKQHCLYDQTFDKDLKKDIALLLQRTAPNPYGLETEFSRGSNHIGTLKNYFSADRNTHLPRIQTAQILEWVKTERKGKDNLEKVLVIKGKKGVGKSTVIADAYRKLIKSSEYYVLALKCDQYYDNNTQDLAKQLFSAGISFEDIFSKAQNSEKPIIVLLDQLDALSQTLSTDRRWIKTYMSLIDYLLQKRNTRVIISSRSFDLEYDADLIRFNDQQKTKHIEVEILSPSEVASVLKILKIDVKYSQLLELLRVPYNLELFSKIPDLSALLEKNTEIDIAKLHTELYRQLLKGSRIYVAGCLDEIVQRMYSAHPNMIEQQYLESFGKEIDYLISQGILVRHGVKLSFFHQSFYEYYLARWFVDSKKDLISYMFEQQQNLYIRSLVKNVIDYLRIADHPKYIQLYHGVLENEKIRFHIQYLFITTLGLIDQPTEKEQEMVYGLLQSGHGKLFMEVFSSSGWLKFILENECLPQDPKTIYGIFYRNLALQPKMILEYIENSELENKHELFSNLLPGLKVWTLELMPFFQRHYPYSENNELWYFEILKKISFLDIEIVLDNLRPIFLAKRSSGQRMKFDYRYDRIVEHLYKVNPKATAEFLFGIHLEILASTDHPYYGPYEKISSPLLGSRHYESDIYYKDSPDEKSIEFFLVKYYRSCQRTELALLFQQHYQSNFVPLLSLLMKLLRDRANEFADEIYLLVITIHKKNGLKGSDDFFSLQVRRLIAASMTLFDPAQYAEIKKILLALTLPYQVYKWSDDKGKKRYQLRFGQKKYLFLKALPEDILKNDMDIRSEYQMLQRRYGELDHNTAQLSSGMKWGGGQSALNNPNFDKFDHDAWLSSMIKINEGYKHEDFMRGDILEHGRSFEAAVEKDPSYFYEFIDSLFDYKGVSPRYISHGISALIKVKDNVEKTAQLIYKEIELSLDREYTQYAIWHSRFLIDQKMVTKNVVDFWIRIARWEPHEHDRLNPGQEMSDFINTPRGTAIDNLMDLGEYPQYEQSVFETIEYIIRPGQVPTLTLSCGIMAHIAYLNRLNNDRAFEIFKILVSYDELEILKHSMNSAQYYNNTRHDEMGFYFQQVLRYPELYSTSYFFVTSWVFDRIDDYEMYDHFMNLGGQALHCAMKVAEDLLIGEHGVGDRCLQVLERCLGQSQEDLSHEFSGLVLRKFTTEHFLPLYNFMEKYVTTVHFAKDPRYLFEYLTECAALYPSECLKLLCKMNLPFKVDITQTAYMGDEPLILVLAIYSKLCNLKFKYAAEQQIALDQFDRMLSIPSIRVRALEAMEKVLN